MAEAVTRWLPATEDRFQYQVSTFGSYHVVLLFSLVLLIPPELHTHFTNATFLPTMILTRERLPKHKYTLYSRRQHPDTTFFRKQNKRGNVRINVTSRRVPVTSVSVEMQ